MAFNISAPQTEYKLNGNGLAEAQLLMSQFNPYQGITDWLEKQGQNIANRNAIDAQDYFDKLNLNDITTAKAQGRDLLKEYSNGRYFFDRTNPAVRMSRDIRDLEESQYALNKYKKALTGAMNTDSLQDGNYQRILQEQGLLNRTAEEMESYNNAYQSAWLKRYEDDLKRQAAKAQFEDSSGKTTEKFVQDQLNRAGITSKSVDDYTGKNLQAAMTDYSNNELSRWLAENGDKNLDAEGLNKFRDLIHKYSGYASDESRIRANDVYTRKLTSVISDAERRAWNDLMERAKTHPDVQKDLSVMSSGDILQKYIYPMVRIMTGYTYGEIMQAGASTRQAMFQGNQELAQQSYDKSAEDTKLAWTNWKNTKQNKIIADTLMDASVPLKDEFNNIKPVQLENFKKNLSFVKNANNLISTIQAAHGGISEDQAVKLLLQTINGMGINYLSYTGSNSGAVKQALEEILQEIAKGFIIRQKYITSNSNNVQTITKKSRGVGEIY